MASRMDRYYQDEKIENLRTKKNKDLYQSIYSDTEYSNIEGITSISRSGKVDIEEIKKLLKTKEENQSDNKRKIETTPEKTIHDEQERTYDIRDILNKAKDEHPSQNRYHSLKNQDYDFLKNIDIQKEEEKVDKELDELVNTLTNVDLFTNVKDEELSLDLLSELKPSGETKVSDNLKKIIQEEVKNYHEKKEENLDQTFFNSNDKFTKEDFSDEDEDFYDKKSNQWLFIVIPIVVIIILAIYFLVIKK